LRYATAVKALEIRATVEVVAVNLNQRTEFAIGSARFGEFGVLKVHAARTTVLGL